MKIPETLPAHRETQCFVRSFDERNGLLSPSAQLYVINYDNLISRL